LGPETLAQVLSELPTFEDEKLIVGLGKADDAAIYKIDDDNCVIQTLDFFTPIVDDPYTYGQIAAANSLSDVYAMGGKPVLALNIVCFPNCVDPEVLSEILKGGADKVKESGAVLAGGHSVDDDEPKYGLSVMGIVKEKNILLNSGAREGDIIAISKPLGLGIVNTAIKGELCSDETYKEAVDVMTSLNDMAAEAAIELSANACTDITGFGLFGHSIEMADNSEVSLEIEMNKIPVIGEALEYASMGLIPAGAYNNRDYYEKKIEENAFKEELITDICYDPQTSGGLLISIPKENREMIKKYDFFKVIGKVVKKTEYCIILK
jgi:selenide,water dikinase